MKFTWSVVHFRRFNPNLHNIFAEEAVLCQELEKSPFCMDYLIRTVPVSLEKPYCFYAEPVWNGSAPHRLTASPLKCYRKKPVLRAICITFHTNFTIRPGGHSNFRCFSPFPPFSGSRPASAFRSLQISICRYLPYGISFQHGTIEKMFSIIV